MPTPPRLAFKRHMRPFHARAREYCGEHPRAPGMARSHGLVHGVVIGTHLTQNHIGHGGHGNGVRGLLVRQPEHFCRGQCAAQAGKVGVIKTHVHVLENVGESLIHLVAQHHTGDEIAPAHLRVFRGGEYGCQHIAGVPAKRAGPVVNVIHFHITRSRAIHIRRHFR